MTSKRASCASLIFIDRLPALLFYDEAWLSELVLFTPDESAKGFRSKVLSKLKARNFCLKMILGKISATRSFVLLSVALLTMSYRLLTFDSSSNVTCVKFLIKPSFKTA